MRKLFIVTVILLFTGIAFAQSFKKNALIGIHTLAITLEENTTMDQFLDFFENKLLPEYEKAFSCDVRLIKGLNRDIENRTGLFVYFKSKNEWNKYFNDDGSTTETGQKAMDKVGPILDEMRKLGTWSSENIVDWVIQ
jgi:hypothetical protein